MTMTTNLDRDHHYLTGGVEPVDPATGRSPWDLPEDVDPNGDKLLEDALGYLCTAIRLHDDRGSGASWSAVKFAAGCSLQLWFQAYTGGRRPELTKDAAMTLTMLPEMLVQLLARVEAAEAATQRIRSRRR